MWIKEAIKIFQYILTYNKSYILSDLLTVYGLKIKPTLLSALGGPFSRSLFRSAWLAYQENDFLNT